MTNFYGPDVLPGSTAPTGRNILGFPFYFCSHWGRCFSPISNRCLGSPSPAPTKIQYTRYV